MNSLSIILVNYNGAEILANCLHSLTQFGAANYETIVIDNASTDNSIELIKDRFPSIGIISNSSNLGFGKANNLAVKQAKGEYLLFLNTDTILTEATPSILLEYLQQHPDVGAIGPRIVFADNSYQLSCGNLPNLTIELKDKIRSALDRRWHHLFANIYDRQYDTLTKVGWVTGACLMIRRDLFARLGGFDEGFFMYFEDKDICKRVGDAGFKVVYYPHTSLIHLLGGSSHSAKKTTNTYYRDSQLYYYRKHLGKFQTEILKLYLKISRKS